MRTTLRQVPADARRYGVRDAVSGWWGDTPYRRPRNWWTLLTESGRGWLRFGFDTYRVQEIIEPELGGPSFEYDCAPPLRRAWIWVWSRVSWVLRAGGWYRYRTSVRHPVTWERLTWRELVLSRDELKWLRDPEWPDSYLLHPRSRR